MYNNIYKNKKVLVSGNTGFKGSFFADWLVSLEANVLGYSLFPNTNPNNFSFSKREYDTVFHDINDYNFLSETLFNFKPSILFHFAAQPIVSEAYNDPISTLNTNILGTARLLDVCRDIDSVKALVIITSDKCYYNNEKGVAFKVGDTLAGLDPYSVSKSCAELVVDSYRYAFLKDKLVATVRAGNCIGGGDWAKNRIITDIVNAIRTKSVLNIRNIDSIRPWSSLWDLLNGYLMVGQKLLEGKTEFARAWNFGPRAGSKLFTIGDILKSFDKYWKAPEINLIPNPIKESNILKLNSKETNEELGWLPALSQEEIFKWTVEWYKNFYENNKIITEEQFNLFKEKIK